ncbi:MAG: DUF922 domain-containing protein [Bacteroidota bacterium]
MRALLLAALLGVLTLTVHLLVGGHGHAEVPTTGAPVVVAAGSSEAPGGTQLENPVITIIDVNTYEVTGRTAAEVLASLQARGPRSGERIFFGLTETEMAFRYWKTPADGECRLERIRIDLRVVVTIPEWRAPGEAPYRLKRDWSRFETALRRHEDQHREIAEVGAREVYRALHALRTPSCTTIDATAREVANRLREANEQRQAAFDRRTGHGRTQGAVWPQSTLG